MKAFGFGLWCLLAGASTLAGDAVAAPPETRHCLVELSCGPGDREAITTTMRTALALRDERVTVTVFVDLAAVQIAVPGSKTQPADLRRETDKLFEMLRTAGILVLVCPHCADQQGVPAKSLRAGLRFTDKQELDAERKRANRVYEYRRPATKPADAPEVAKDRTT